MQTAEAKVYRDDLEPPPSRIGFLPVHRGYPVPWFVAWVNGVPEFRAAEAEKFQKAILEKLCWVCGDVLGRYKTFVAGPMCGINRISSEPPCHLECAQWSARNCPFLSKPQMVRRENDLPEGYQEAPGVPIDRNPGVTMLWTTLKYHLLKVDESIGKKGYLLVMHEPTAVEWWAVGKPATREQVEESIRTGLPTLLNMAKEQGEQALLALDKAAVAFWKWLPKE